MTAVGGCGGDGGGDGDVDGGDGGQMVMATV